MYKKVENHKVVGDTPSVVIGNQVKDFYKLNPTHIDRFEGGTESSAWLVVTDDGKFIAKIFGEQSSTPEKVAEEVALYDYINSSGQKMGIRAPKVVPDTQGQLIRTIDNQPFILMKHEELVRLQPLTVSRSEVTSLSKAVANLHLMLQSKVSDYQKVDYSGWNLRYNQEAYETLSTSPNAEACSDEELKQYQKTIGDIVSFLDREAYPKGLKESLLHTDICFEHALLMPDGSFYFFDWTDREHGPLARELSVFLFHTYREEDISFERWQELKDWILDSYNEVNKLEKKDIGIIIPFMLRRCLDEVQYLSRLAIKINDQVDVTGIKRRMKLAGRLISSTF